jgi:hypothetical protein
MLTMLVLIAGAARTLDTGAARGLKKAIDTACALPEESPFWVVVSSTLLPSAIRSPVCDRSGPYTSQQARGRRAASYAWQALCRLPPTHLGIKRDLLPLEHFIEVTFVRPNILLLEHIVTTNHCYHSYY